MRGSHQRATSCADFLLVNLPIIPAFLTKHSNDCNQFSISCYQTATRPSLQPIHRIILPKVDDGGFLRMTQTFGDLFGFRFGIATQLDQAYLLTCLSVFLSAFGLLFSASRRVWVNRPLPLYPPSASSTELAEQAHLFGQHAHACVVQP